MALRFDQTDLPDGVFHLLIDDGDDITHLFAERARWSDVARAASQGSTIYAETHWHRKSRCPMLDGLAILRRPRWLRRREDRLQDVRSGPPSS